MNRLFLFCIGGTGSRVLKSLIYLLASGVKVGVRQIIPIIIDPDKDNGDVELVTRLLNYYRFLRAKGFSDKTEFFNAEIEKLSGIGDGTVSDISPNYKLDISLEGTQGIPFKNFIGYDTLDVETKALMQLLYSEKRNLQSELTVGFKGNPHMGSIVLNRFKDSRDFSYFVNQITPDDRIFIVSSIFGGTGAAGFPLLVKNIRQPHDSFIGKAAVLKQVPLGAISVLPYFGVEPDKNSAIDKNTFINKTKAALAFYNNDLRGINVLYQIGDRLHKDYKNSEGGVNQRNDAHLVEMASALAVVDFSFKDKVEMSMSSETICQEFGVLVDESTDDRVVNFNNLGISTRTQVANQLTQFYYTWQFWKNRLPTALRNTNLPFVKGAPGVPLDISLLTNSFYKDNLEPFCKLFEDWLREMSNNERAFRPFNLDTPELQYMVEGVQQKKYGLIFKSDKWDYADYETALGKIEPQMGGLSTEQKLFALFSIATDLLYKERIAEAIG